MSILIKLEHSKILNEKAHVFELKRYDFTVEIEATSQDAAFTLFKKQYIDRLDLSDGGVTISVSLREGK